MAGGQEKGILGKAAPAAGQLEVVYKVPKGKRAEVRVIVTNRGAEDAFRVAVTRGAGTANPDYIAYDKPIGANESLTTVPIKIGSGDDGQVDIVRVRSTNGTLSFQVTGEEFD